MSEPKNESPAPSKTSETKSVAPIDSQLTVTTPTIEKLTSPTALMPTLGSEKRLRSNKQVRSRDSLSAFEEASGPRQDIAGRIAANKLTPDQQRLVLLLLDPGRARDSIATIASDAGVTPDEVLSLFRSGAVAEAHAIYVGKMAEGLPEVTRTIIDQATSRRLDCPCKVTHENQADPRCTKCRGSGFYIEKGQTDQQKMVLESMELVKKSSGINLNQTTNVGVAIGAGGLMDRFVRATDAVAYDVHPEVVEGEKIA